MTEVLLFAAFVVVFTAGLGVGWFLTALEVEKRRRRGGYVDVKDLEW